MKAFSRKPKPLKLDNICTGEPREPSTGNIYVGLKFSRAEDKCLKKPALAAEEELVIRFKLYTRECARCILGDPGLTCTCSFRHRAPDFKLYEDDEKFLNNFHTIGTYV